MFFPKLDKQSLTDGIVIPQMVKVHQSFPHTDLADPVGVLKKQLLTLDTATTEALKGKRIGITAGSRGLPHYKEIMKALCDQLKAWGAKPFVFPAMGSHAGATAEGQKEHLAQFGINEDYLGVPVLSTMDVVEVATLEDGFPVYCDKNAYEADGIILFNKIKPHTHFKYKHESGLLKMICIGCGKHKGASTFHGRGYDSFGPNLERVSKAFLQHVNVVFSVGMVQSPSDDIAALEVIPTDKFFERDAALQTMAKAEMPRLKLPHIDVLIVDEIGKEISGTGMDPKHHGPDRTIQPGNGLPRLGAGYRTHRHPGHYRSLPWQRRRLRHGRHRQLPLRKQDGLLLGIHQLHYSQVLPHGPSTFIRQQR